MPSRGGQPSARKASACPGGFNSCPHAEGNHMQVELYTAKKVSIRALTRRATCKRRADSGPQGFQFVPSRGGQRLVRAVMIFFRVFQFVPSRGGQHTLYSIRQNQSRFNSCPHAEGNPDPKFYALTDNLFQFVPSRGGQPETRCTIIRAVEFQFVPSRGGQLFTPRRTSSVYSVSIRALTRRATGKAVPRRT